VKKPKPRNKIKILKKLFILIDEKSKKKTEKITIPFI
jgi:hypothetical protein